MNKIVEIPLTIVWLFVWWGLVAGSYVVPLRIAYLIYPGTLDSIGIIPAGIAANLLAIGMFMCGVFAGSMILTKIVVPILRLLGVEAWVGMKLLQ